MKIERMNKGSWGKVRAFFDLSTKEGFTIKGFKLIEGINGLFVSVPSQKGKDEEWYETVWIESKELRENLNNTAINTYNEGMSSGMDQRPEPTTQVDNFDQTIGENLSDKKTGTSEQAEPDEVLSNPDKEPEGKLVSDPKFNEDDIPF